LSIDDWQWMIKVFQSTIDPRQSTIETLTS
jgi:hypothetical protein